MEYSYLREKKTVNGKTTKYHLVGDKVTQEVSSTDTIYYTYDAEQNLVSINLNGSEYYYIRNGQGDIIWLCDSGGRQAVSYNYDTWGKLVNINGPLASTVGEKNPYRYRGYRYDSETGFYYLQSRYYNPEWGRFINADAVGGQIGTLLSHNVFAYVMNNPVNMEDPSGYWPKWAKGLAIAAGTVVAVAAIVVAAPIAACAIGTGIAMATGASAATALAITSVATVGAYAIAAGVGVFGANRAYQAVSSKNVIRDKVFRGNQRAYDTAEDIVNMAGAMVVGTATSSPGGTCFVAGTLVATEKGYIPIEQIKAGDLVYAENPDTGEKALKTVIETYVKETKQLIYVYVGNEKIETTAEHPFYVEGKGWVNAFHLKTGEALVLKNGEHKLVKSVEVREVDKPVTVYNFQVADFHTYYVTKDAVLIHNANCGRKTEKMGKIKGNAPGNNQAQNKQFKSVVTEFKLNKNEQQLLHQSITGQGYGYQEIRDEAIYLFPRLDK